MTVGVLRRRPGRRGELRAGAAAPHGPSDVDTLAEALHRGAIGLLRGVRAADEATGVSPPRLSALSVLVFGGAQSLKSLAAAEGVKPPTMSKLVSELEAAGLVRKSEDRADGRGVRIEATAAGRKLMFEGRDRRLALLTARLQGLSREERADLRRAAPALLRLAMRA